MKRLFLLCALLPTPAFADACMDLSDAKKQAEARHARWIDLTPDQWQFMRGIFLANPRTPDRLPYGTGAAMAEASDESAGAIFFIDGDRACDAMVLTKARMPTLADVGSGVVLHEEKKAGENP